MSVERGLCGSGRVILRRDVLLDGDYVVTRTIVLLDRVIVIHNLLIGFLGALACSV